jgi:hypothetical protein
MTPFNPLNPGNNLPATSFPATSRYNGLQILKYKTPDGREIAYVARRIVPQPDRFETLREHEVGEGDRPDNLAANYLGDPEQFWRLADANNSLNPFDLTAEIGHKIRITLPEGIPGMPYVS